MATPSFQHRGRQAQLYEAAKRNSVKKLDSLLGLGEVDLDLRDRLGWTALCYAAWYGNLASAVFLVDAGAHVNVGVERDGLSPLHCAAHEGHLDVVRFLLDCGAPVDAQSKDNTTPLMLACSEGHAAVAEYLLDNKADPRREADNGGTPLYFAAFQGRTRIVKRLLAHPDVDINHANRAGVVPLHGAAFNGHTKVVKLMMEAGADGSISTESGHSALYYATVQGNRDLTTLLLEYVDDQTLEPGQILGSPSTRNLTGLGGTSSEASGDDEASGGGGGGERSLTLGSTFVTEVGARHGPTSPSQKDRGGESEATPARAGRHGLRPPRSALRGSRRSSTKKKRKKAATSATSRTPRPRRGGGRQAKTPQSQATRRRQTRFNIAPPSDPSHSRRTRSHKGSPVSPSWRRSTTGSTPGRRSSRKGSKKGSKKGRSTIQPPAPFLTEEPVSPAKFDASMVVQNLSPNRLPDLGGKAEELHWVCVNFRQQAKDLAMRRARIEARREEEDLAVATKVDRLQAVADRRAAKASLQLRRRAHDEAVAEDELKRERVALRQRLLREERAKQKAEDEARVAREVREKARLDAAEARAKKAQADAELDAAKRAELTARLEVVITKREEVLTKSMAVVRNKARANAQLHNAQISTVRQRKEARDAIAERRRAEFEASEAKRAAVLANKQTILENRAANISKRTNLAVTGALSRAEAIEAEKKEAALAKLARKEERARRARALRQSIREEKLQTLAQRDLIRTQAADATRAAREDTKHELGIQLVEVYRERADAKARLASRKSELWKAYKGDERRFRARKVELLNRLRDGNDDFDLAEVEQEIANLDRDMQQAMSAHQAAFRDFNAEMADEEAAEEEHRRLKRRLMAESGRASGGLASGGFGGAAGSHRNTALVGVSGGDDGAVSY